MNSKDWDRLAESYHSEVISPFQDGVVNPLFENIEKIKGTHKMSIADIGCGRGEILDLLAEKFCKVHAIDFSKSMIKTSKRLSSRKNIQYFVRDMKNLSEFKNRFDVVVCCNSILMPGTGDLKKSIDSVYDTMKKGALFFGIFPSMESVIYNGFLVLDQQYEKFNDDAKALVNAGKMLEKNKYDFIKATYSDGGDVQKFFYEFEIKERLRSAGFSRISIGKVLYPWRKDVSDFANFPGKPKMWDWFVSARK